MHTKENLDAIEKSIADGNTFHVIVLTRNAGYVKRPEGHERLTRALYRSYPKLVETIARRHELYAAQIALCERLEREGRALIVRPAKPLWDSRSVSDVAKLLALYDEGEAIGATLRLLGA
jgi:predicted patatin/cPLA2 family phospholipase